MTRARVLAAALVALLVLLAMGRCRGEERHVGSDAPPSEQFEADFRRDLKAYFEGAAVGFELLRNEPTKSGIAHPKYYAWVRATAADGQVREGAVRVNAVDRTHFEVTDFVTADAIRANPDAVEQIFPAPLCPGIRERAHAR